MTQERLAKLVGVSQVAISEWERGVVNPSKLPELADALGVDRNEFVKQWAFRTMIDNDVEKAIQLDPHLARDAKDALLTAYRYMRNAGLENSMSTV